MFEDISVKSVERKLVTVRGKRYLCDIIIIGNQAIVNGENLETGEKTGWITINDTLNPAFSFGEYLKEHIFN